MQIISGPIKAAQKVVIYGPEGIGKSTFASKFPDPLFIDTEGSTKGLDVRRTPRPTSWIMLTEQVKAVRTDPSLCKTLVIDTADWAEQLCTGDLCAKAQKSGIEDYGYGKGYVYLAEEFGRLLNLLEEVVERGVNVVMTAHAQMRKFEQPDEMGAYDRFELKLQKKTAPLLMEWADMVLFANYKTYVVNVDGQGTQKGKNKVQGGQRVMYTSHHPCWDAKNRHGLAPELKFEYSEIAHLIPTGESKAEPVPAAPIQEKPLAQLEIKPEEESKEIKPAERTSEPAEPEPVVQPPEPAESKPEEPAPVPAPAPAEPPRSVENLPAKAAPVQNDSDNGIPRALLDLMHENGVLTSELRKAVAIAGYYPESTPFERYAPDFVTGCLIGDWAGVYRTIVEKVRTEIPF